MSGILIFGGTTEGRRLAQIFAKNKIKTELCVASEYGEKLMEFSDFEELSPSENSFLKIKTCLMCICWVEESRRNSMRN